MARNSVSESEFDDTNHHLSSLIDRAQMGSVASRNDLLSELRSYLMAIANSQLGSRLQGKMGPSDIVQQSMIRAVENFGDYRGKSEAEFRCWLRQIVINETRLAHRGFSTGKRDYRREKELQADDSAAAYREPIDPNQTPATHTLAVEHAEDIKRLINQLPENYQMVLRLRNWEELSFEEIAHRMGLSVSGAAKVWYRALVEIQRLYQKDHGPSNEP